MSTQVLESLIDTHYPAAARGDRDAYGRIVAGCQSTVTSIALAIVRDVPASEDIAQEAFLSAWQHLRKLHNPASFLPWLRHGKVPGWIPHVATSVGFALGIVFASGWWLPRILTRRRAHAISLDPVGAAKRQRRERVLGWIGATAGLGCATAGLVLGLYFSGRMG